MPTRLIREGLLTSDAVNSLPEDAEVFYTRLMLVVDDYGRFEANLAIIRARCFPLQLDRWPLARVGHCLSIVSNARTLSGTPLVSVYEVSGKRYLQVNNFGQRTRSASKFPQPSDGQCLTLPDNDGQCPPNAEAKAYAEAKAEPTANGTPQRQEFADDPGDPLMEHHPETTSAIVRIFPDVDDAFVRYLIQKCVQEVISANQPVELVTDESIAAAICKVYKRGQKSAGLFLTTVPACIRNWATTEA